MPADDTRSIQSIKYLLFNKYDTLIVQALTDSILQGNTSLPSKRTEKSKDNAKPNAASNLQSVPSDQHYLTQKKGLDKCPCLVWDSNRN